MLSRSLSIHRTPGESPSRRPAPVYPSTERGSAEALLKGRVLRRMLLLLIFATMLLSLLLLNMNGVVEPRLRMLMVTFNHPGLLPVLLLTSVLSVVSTVAFRAVVCARRQLAETRGSALTTQVENEAARLKHNLGPRAAVAS
jgi:hypothetical protein